MRHGTNVVSLMCLFSVGTTADAAKPSSLRPARKLLADIVGVNIARQEEASFKCRLIAYDVDQSRKFYAVVLPLMV